jgi:hypothetical protein
MFFASALVNGTEFFAAFFVCRWLIFAPEPGPLARPFWHVFRLSFGEGHRILCRILCVSLAHF